MPKPYLYNIQEREIDNRIYRYIYGRTKIIET